MKNRKVVMLLSGGADSVAAYLKLLDTYHDIHPVFYDYGQPNLEVERALALEVVDKTNNKNGLRVLSLALLKTMQYGSVTDEQAFVPHRNTLFLIVGAVYAEKIQADGLCIGYMKNDVSFFDNSIEHHKIIEDIIKKNVGRDFEVMLPLKDMTKKDVMQYLKNHYNMDKTVSCWSAKLVDGKIVACGTCANCLERQGAEKEVNK